ncbi:MAG: hypothetical protein WCX66_04140 [archaeon]|jgi:uncharacterized protein (UPF0333 family)
MKGQIAFESMLLLLIVITSVSLITSLYFQIHDETLAITYARIGTLEEINKSNEEILIEKISYEKNPPTIKIKLNKLIQINTNKIKEVIEQQTNIKNINIQLE